MGPAQSSRAARRDTVEVDWFEVLQARVPAGPEARAGAARFKPTTLTTPPGGMQRCLRCMGISKIMRDIMQGTCDYGRNLAGTWEAKKES